MAITIGKEELVPLHNARKLLPCSVCRRTVYRYAKNGYRGIVLESIHSIGGLYTSKEAIVRFLERIADQEGMP